MSLEDAPVVTCVFPQGAPVPTRLLMHRAFGVRCASTEARLRVACCGGDAPLPWWRSTVQPWGVVRFISAPSKLCCRCQCKKILSPSACGVGASYGGARESFCPGEVRKAVELWVRVKSCRFQHWQDHSSVQAGGTFARSAKVDRIPKLRQAGGSAHRRPK